MSLPEAAGSAAAGRPYRDRSAAGRRVGRSSTSSLHSIGHIANGGGGNPTQSTTTPPTSARRSRSSAHLGATKLPPPSPVLASAAASALSSGQRRPYGSRSRLSASPARTETVTLPGTRDAAPSSAHKAAAGSKPGGLLCCDRCDGKHTTASCPHYKKERDRHPDATRRKPLSMGDASGPPLVLRQSAVRVHPQPGDGSCLFHSMTYGMGTGTASALRRELAAYVLKNADLKISETPMRDWVKWDSGSTVQTYSRRMAVGGWGGGIEMAACARLKKVNVHVYERAGGGFKRISLFDAPGGSTKTIHVLYRGGVHYDALQVV